MKATVLISKNGEQIQTVKERLREQLESGDIEDYMFESKMQEIEPEEFENETIYFHARDVKRFNTQDKGDKLLIEFNDGYCVLLKNKEDILKKLEIEFSL